MLSGVLGQGKGPIAWGVQDEHQAFTALGVVGLAFAAAMAIWGLPSVDLHGPFHRIGVMDPLCGGTRAAYLAMRGELRRAWVYNPLGILAVGAALVATARVCLRVIAGRWVNVTLALTPRGRRFVYAVLVVLMIALEIRQQLRADYLMSSV